MRDLKSGNGPDLDLSRPDRKKTTTRSHNHEATDAVSIVRGGDTSSREVSWWAVHEYVASVLNRVGDWPLVGTPAWVALADDDPRKIAAVFDASQHYALRLDCEQEARIEASHALSVAADWKEQAQRMTARNSAYIRRAS